MPCWAGSVGREGGREEDGRGGFRHPSRLPSVPTEREKGVGGRDARRVAELGIFDPP